MITWLQTSFGRHHKLVLGLLLGVTIISFVFFDAWSGVGSMRATKFLGVNLNSPRQLERYSNIFALQYGQVPQGNFGYTEEGQFLIFSLHLADTLQIPNPNTAQLREFLGTIYGGQENIATKVAEQVQAASRIFGVNEQQAKSRLEQVYNDIWRLQRAEEILSGPGHALNSEAVSLWKERNTDWTIEAASLGSDSFQPAIQPTEEQLQTYFESHKQSYELPPEVALSYVIFPAADAAGFAAPSDAELRQFAMANAQQIEGFDFTKIDESIAAHRDAILQRWTQEQTGLRAASAASNFLAEELPFAEKAEENPTSAEIDQKLAARQLRRAPIPAFSKNNVPQELPVPADILRQGLNLSTLQWRSDAFAFGDKAVVLFHEKATPARLPELAEVRAQVAADFSAQERTRLFAEHVVAQGKILRETVAQGGKFAETAQSLGFVVKPYPAFRIATMPSDFYGVAAQFFTSLAETPVGGVTPLLRNQQSATFVHVLQKTEAPLGDSNAAEIAQIQAALASQAATTTWQGNRQLGTWGARQEVLFRLQNSSAR